MATQADHQKRALRAELRERRRNLTSTELENTTAGLTANLISLVTEKGARNIACYLSSQTEPNTRPFVNWAVEQEMRILFPISREDGLLDWTVGETGTEIEGMFGINEAVGELLGPIAINDVDLIIVPAAAVDQTGMRMGWGRGYFDKTLGSMDRCPPVFAVIYDPELRETVPQEVHDRPVDGVVTPLRIVEF